MINQVSIKAFIMLVGVLPIMSFSNSKFLLDETELSLLISEGDSLKFFSDINCTESKEQIIYTTQSEYALVSTSAPVFTKKTVSIVSNNQYGESEEITLSNKDVSLILDQDQEIPRFVVFNERGKVYCSLDMGLLNFPNHFSYRCLTKDRKVITAGVLKSQPIAIHDPVRKLVNDNINNTDIDFILKDNIVIECFKSSNWLGVTFTINVNVTPMELNYYREDIVAMLKMDYDEMDNLNELEAYNTDENEYDEVDEFIESENIVSDNLNPQDATDEPEPEISQAIPAKAVPKSEAEDNPNLGTRNVPKLEETITAEEKDAIQKEAEDKLYRLQDSFVKLGNRDYSAQQKQRERETTVQDLFINERANVGVSSVNSDVISNYLIGDYLLRLERMISGAYQKVEIVFSEIHRVSNFKKNPDGTWSATVTFSQQFTGFGNLDGDVKYSDVTQKSVTVIIRRIELFTGDSTPEVYWEVLLSDIGVNQTEPFK